jgi:flagellar hook-associated protein 2
MPISLGGLASGIDTGSLIDSLMSVANQPVNQLTTRKTQLDSASQTISSFSSKLSTLKNAALALSTTVGFASFSASSSDPAVVATASGAASVGSYSVTVEALARAQKTRSATFGSNTTALGMSGSFDIQVGTGDAKSVDVLDTDTLSDIAAKITSSGARVSASVMNDGTGYRLIVQGLDTGAASSFTLGETGTALGFGAPGNTYETARDAAFTVDNMSVTSPTNQVSGVIGGVKLALTKVTTEPLTLQISSDSTALKAKVTTFVSAYNDFINTGHTAAGFGGTKAANSFLSADSSIRTALHRIGGLVSGVVSGTSGKYTTMGSVGIKLGQDGTLTLDSTKFEAAMSSDADSVRRLFVTDTTTGATGLMKTLMSGIDGLVTGAGAPLQARIDSLSAQSKRVAEAKIKMESRLADYEQLLKKQFTAMDQLIAKYKTMSSALDSSILSNTTNNSSNG